MASVIVVDAETFASVTGASVISGAVNAEGHLILARQGQPDLDLGPIGRAVGTGSDIELVAGDEDAFLDHTTVMEESVNQDATNWVNRMMGRFKPFGAAIRTVAWFNEYFELRLAPAKHNTTAFVIYVRENSDVQPNARNQTVPLFVLRDDRDLRTHYWGLYDEGVVKFGPGAHVDVPQIVLDAVEAVPADLPAGTIIHRLAP